MGKFEEVMSKMELKNPPPKKMYGGSSGLQCIIAWRRRIGWILLSIGAMIILSFGGYKMVAGIIQDPSTPFR